MQFWKGSRIWLHKQKTVQSTSPRKQLLQPHNHHQLSTEQSQQDLNGPGEKWGGGLASLHCLHIPAQLHTTTPPARFATNLSLAHLPKILLASASEECFISRGFLHSPFFQLPEQYPWTLATLRETYRQHLLRRQGRSGSFGNVFTPMGMRFLMCLA